MWVIEKNSSLGIDGSSNINKFTCDVKEYLRPDTLRGAANQTMTKYVFTANSNLSIDIRSFDCHQKYITSDFRKMLKANEYPSLVIRFLNLDEFHNGVVVKGQVLLELAGKKKTIDVSYNCTQPSAGRVQLNGFKIMKFSDFGLEPPRKIGGLIRINEEIRVNFNLYFRKLNS